MKTMTAVLQKAWIDCALKLKSFRFISAIAMVVCLVLTTISGLDEVIDMVGEGMSIWIVPHIFDNKFFATFYGLIIVYLFSDVPFFNHQELYYMTRLGRGKWVIEKLLSMIMVSVAFVALSFLICILSFAPNITISGDWGKVIRTVAYGFVKEDIMCYMSTEILYQYTPEGAMETCFVMVLIITVMTGLLMFAISIATNRNLAVIVPSCVVLLNFSALLYDKLLWLPKINVYAWYRISIYNKRFNMERSYPDFTYCFKAVIIFAIISLVIVAVRVKHTEFDWTSKEG